MAEDDYLVALDLIDQLQNLGGTIVGPFHDVASACDALPAARPDVAVLDIKLGHELVYPLADRLMELGVPFGFTTGFDASALPPRFASVPRLTKPVAVRDLEATLRTILPRAAPGQPGR